MMVDLQNLKNALNEGSFSDDVKQAASAIIDAAITRGGEITVEEKQKLLNLVDLDMDRNDFEQGADEEVKEMLESFISDVDSAAKTASDNIEDSGENFEEETNTQPVQAEPTQSTVSTEPNSVPQETPQQ